MKYGDIEFGFASAEEEGAQARNLLRMGFLDPQGVIEEAIGGSKYLFLGYKGSGKSAIGERLRLLAEEQSLLFVRNTFLSDFPYSKFAKVYPGDGEPESRYPAAWSWLLMLALVKSLSRDLGAESDSALQLERLMEFLERTGMLATDDLRDLVLISSKKSFKTQIPKVLEMGVERNYEGLDLQFSQLIAFTRDVLCSYRSESTHLLVIDGLDDILSAREVQFQALAGLVLSVSRLNADLRRSGTKAKVVLLCRTDLFERLPGPNKNKFRQDGGFELDWYHDPRQPQDSRLYELANLRGQLSCPGMGDIAEQFFVRSVDGRSLTSKFLLELTRHTPRDFLQLLKHIQKFSGEGLLTREQLLSGARDYSLNYFLPELKDELVGYVPLGRLDEFVEMVGSLRKREFKYSELEQVSEKFGIGPDDLKQALRALFACSGLGNVNRRPTGSVYYNFKYRNRNSSFNIGEPLLLHMGVWKALNLA